MRTRTNQAGVFVSLAELMRDFGIKKPIIPGSTDETTWLTIMKQHWKNLDDPTFRIRGCCPNMIEEFTNAVYASQSDREILTQTYKEKLEDVRNHAMDATKYLMLTRPTVHARRHNADNQVWRKWIK